MKKFLFLVLVLIFSFSSIFALGEGEKILESFTKEHVGDSTKEGAKDISVGVESSEVEGRFSSSALNDKFEVVDTSFDSDLVLSTSKTELATTVETSRFDITNSYNVVTEVSTTSSRLVQEDVFVPSIEAKTAPDTSEITVYSAIPEGTEVGSSEPYPFLKYEGYFTVTELGNMTSEIGEKPIMYILEGQGYNAEIVGAVLKEYITIASYADRTDLTDECKSQFELAYQELRACDDVSSLIPELYALLGSNVFNDYSISQIFFLGPRADIIQYLDEEDILHLRMVFPVTVDKDKEAPLICYKVAEVSDWNKTEGENVKQPGEWGMIEPENVVINWPKEGNIAADFRYFGTIIFLEKKAK